MSAQNRAGVPPQETGGTTAANDVAVAADPAVTPGGAGAPDGGSAPDFGHSESRGDARPVSFARRVVQQPTAKLGFLLTGLVLLVALLGPLSLIHI